MQTEFWYYYRDKKNVPIVTVYIIMDLIEGDYARGISICSINDNPEKEEGRFWSRVYALDALKEKQTSNAILREDVLDLLETIEDYPGEFYDYKSWYLPELTDKELSLFEKASNKLNKFVKGDD